MNISMGSPIISGVTGAFGINGLSASTLFNRGTEKARNLLDQRAGAWRDLNTRFLALETAAADLQEPGNWIFRTTSTRAGEFSATASTFAPTGTYQVRVDQLARYHRIASEVQTSLYNARGLAGTITVDGLEVEIAAADSLEDIRDAVNVVNSTSAASDQQLVAFASAGGVISVNGTKITVPAGSTLRDIRDLINAETGAGLKAAVQDNRLLLGADENGTAPELGDVSGTVLTEIGLMDPGSRVQQPYSQDLTAYFDDSRLVLAREATTDRLGVNGDTALLKTLGFLDTNSEIKNELTAPQEAQVTVNGTAYTSQTNTVEDAIPGVTLVLAETSPYARNLTVSADTTAPREMIEGFIGQYNNAVTRLNELLGEDGAFRLDRDIWDIRLGLVKNMQGAVEGFRDPYTKARDIGLGLAGAIPSVIEDVPRVDGDGDEVIEVSGAKVTASGSTESLQRLSRIGIIYNEDKGTISADYDVLNAALASEPAVVQSFFTADGDNIALRFSEQMEGLVRSSTGRVAGELRVIELLQEDLENVNESRRSYDTNLSKAKQDYLSLLSIKNVMDVQKKFLESYNIL